MYLFLVAIETRNETYKFIRQTCLLLTTYVVATAANDAVANKNKISSQSHYFNDVSQFCIAMQEER